MIAAVRQAEGAFGGIDVLVNNAGYGYRAAVEEGDQADVRRLFATNFFGPVALIKAALPGMRARRSGAIVNVSSIGAGKAPAGIRLLLRQQGGARSHDGLVAQGGGAAPGIKVIAVEPGGFRTDFSVRSLMQSATAIDDYAETACAAAQGERQRPRHSAGRPGPRRPGDHRSRRGPTAAVPAPARPRRPGDGRPRCLTRSAPRWRSGGNLSTEHRLRISWRATLTRLCLERLELIRTKACFALPVN